MRAPKRPRAGRQECRCFDKTAWDPPGPVQVETKQLRSRKDLSNLSPTLAVEAVEEGKSEVGSGTELDGRKFGTTARLGGQADGDQKR
jgi:hypothetical protein